MMEAGKRRILLYTEAELYVTSLQTYRIEEVGTKSWFQQHVWLEKLNMQAIVNATSNEDEFVKDLLVTVDKIPIVVHDLIVTEVWKLMVFPRILKIKIDPWISFPLYIVLHHEATIINLLETILYYEDCCDTIQDNGVDLVDYCHRKLLFLVSDSKEESKETAGAAAKKFHEYSVLEQLELQNREIEFHVALKVLSIVRYITDYLKRFPLVVTSRMLNTHDFPMLLVSLIESPPWERQRGNNIEKHINGKWTVVPTEELTTLTKIEGQVWIALFHLLIDTHCQTKYELNNYRKNKILKLRPYMTDTMLDQLPPLVAMRQYFERLSFMEPPPAKRDLILEQIPEIWGTTMKDVENNLDEIVDRHIEILFNNSDSFYQEQAQEWAEIYDFNLFQKIPQDGRCAFCGNLAKQRCARCHTEWYCRRQCQVKHWKKHRSCCDLVANSEELSANGLQSE